MKEQQYSNVQFESGDMWSMFDKSFSDDDWKRLDQALDWLNEVIVEQEDEIAHKSEVLLQHRKNLLSRYGLNPQLLANVERREQYSIAKPGRSFTVALCKALSESGKIPAVSEFSFAHWLVTGEWLFPEAETEELSAAAIASKLKGMKLSPEQKTQIIQSLVE